MKQAFFRAFIWVTNVINVHICLRGLRWASRHLDSVADQIKAVREEEAKSGIKGYTPAVHNINTLVLAAAFQDKCDLHESSPEESQAVLNACMESIRNCEKVKGSAFSMMAYLISQGYPPDEAMVRVFANILQIGMLLEARLRKEVVTA